MAANNKSGAAGAAGAAAKGNNKAPGGANNKSGNNSQKSAKDIALSYNKNTPMMLMVGLFLTFIIYQFLKVLRNRDNMLKQKIDQEITKKLYFKDEE